ncbi:Unconventional myosin-XVIIIb [Pseudolycoriella hygida]|uniref:Unconventional myosin-XVIIIb n=1 Tax=Pseudolycoriella hygida TaxID=35572 RepID=A0A9Q0MQR4_9DIPT|nr:Unconventional myosin-XVIIIb [Pseudolycoriella hygida]
MIANMFNFIKKGVVDKERDKTDRKEKRKKDKKTKDGVSTISSSMSSEELLRLDEVRRSLKIRGRRKEKEKLPSGITADYSAEFFAHLPKDDENEIVASKQRRKINIDNNVDSEHLSAHSFSYSDSSETSLNSSGNKNDPMRPPRGILKGHRHSSVNGNDDSTRTPDSPDLVVRNTLRNQLITYENVSNIACEYIHEEVSTDTVILNIKNTLTSPSPSADSLTETTSSSFATPPFSLSPVGESQGSQRWSRVQDYDGLNLPLPPINLLKLPPPRELVINRQNTPKKDFGFSLRNAIRMDRSDLLFLPDLKPTIFAEPGNTENTGLLPGDRLIAVNGKSVEDLSRNTIIEMIRNCDDSVRVKVQPVAELVELSKRSMSDGCFQNGNHLQHSKDSMPSNNSDVWLVHKGGFTAAIKLPQSISDKVNVTLKHNGDIITVDEDDLEKTNPPEQDLVEDLCNLKHLNEASVLHCIRQRFGNNLIHTKAGNILIVVNPMQPLSLYSEKVLLLEKSRAGCLHSKENSFHVLSHLVAGADPMLLKELNLDNIPKDSVNSFATIYKSNEELQKATSEFAKLVQSFVVLNISDKHVKAIWNVLGAIVHLGFAGVTTVENGAETRLQFKNPTSARQAANLLGITMEDLTSSILFKRDKETIPKQGLLDHALEYFDSLVIGLYSEVFARVIALINRAIQRNVRTISSILLIDTPGFQNPSSCGSQEGAKLFDLQHNYLQERLQLLFHDKTLVAPRTLYSQELVEIDKEAFTESDPSPLIGLLDKATQSNIVRSTKSTSQRDNTRRSLFAILDEESTNASSSDEMFYDRICTNFSDREYHFLIRPTTHSQFILQHMQGTNPVLYSINGWLKQNKDNFHSNLAANLLQDSHKSEINELFAISSSGAGDGRSFGGSIGGVERSQSLRRISSLRRSFTSLGGKRNSPMMKHNAATYSKTPNATLSYTIEDIVNVPLLRSQLRGTNILEATQLHKLGFPESIPHSEFSRRFGLLNDVTTKANGIETILSTVDIDSSLYRIGPSQVLLRSGVLSRLEAKREELLRDRIIHLQAICRGYLARQRVSRKRVQVKDWPWWRLLVRITPLLDVNRTDEQLKAALSDIQNLKQKLEKSEAERNFLKNENEKLECKCLPTPCRSILS